eukprot:m.333546 g.333546  ORF g.333546 m.333546 type:complete len:64 (-) comp17169_c0_seq1:26-217(-)
MHNEEMQNIILDIKDAEVGLANMCSLTCAAPNSKDHESPHNRLHGVFNQNLTIQAGMWASPEP